MAKIIAQLYGKSTGWNGKDFSGPVTDIRMLGSDGTIFLDGRRSVVNQIYYTKLSLKTHIQKNSITGFKILRYPRSFSDKPTELSAFIPFTASEEGKPHG